MLVYGEIEDAKKEEKEKMYEKLLKQIVKGEGNTLIIGDCVIRKSFENEIFFYNQVLPIFVKF